MPDAIGYSKPRRLGEIAYRPSQKEIKYYPDEWYKVLDQIENIVYRYFKDIDWWKNKDTKEKKSICRDVAVDILQSLNSSSDKVALAFGKEIKEKDKDGNTLHSSS